MNHTNPSHPTRSRCFRLAVPLALLAATALAGNALAGDFELRGDPEAGDQPYQLQCASCHGNTARGDGPAARAFDPPPSDLTRDELDAEHLFTATSEGGPAVGLTATMPPFKHSLDEDTIHDIVAYIQSLE